MMSPPEKSDPTFVRVTEKIIAHLERAGRDAAEIQLYRDLAKQALALAPAIVLGGQDAIARLDAIVANFGERMQRYLIDQLAEYEETRALAPGAAAPAAGRLYDALDHLVKTTDDEHHWVSRAGSPIPAGLLWHQRNRHVTLSVFDERLDGLRSAVSAVAEAAHTADRALSGANHLWRSLLETPETSVYAVTAIGGADPHRAVAPQDDRAQDGSPSMNDLRKRYMRLLHDIRNRATDLQQLLKKREHPVGGASTYTVRDAVARAEAMIRWAQMEIEALRWVIYSGGLRTVDADQPRNNQSAAR